MRVQFDEDVNLEEAEIDEILQELVNRIKYKTVTFEAIITYLVAHSEHKDKDIVTEKDLIAWKIFAGVSR